MSQLFKNKKMLTIILTAIIAVVTLGTAAAAYFMSGNSFMLSKPSGDATESGDMTLTDGVLGENVNADGEEVTAEPVVFNKPGKMRAVYLTPGVDFMKESTSGSTVQKEIDTALTQAKDMSLNTVFLNVFSDKGTMFSLESIVQACDFDVLEYTVSKAREMNLYIYVIYDLSAVAVGDKLEYASQISSENLDNILNNLNGVLDKYSMDGILFTGYYNETKDDSYPTYLKTGGGVGFENYMMDGSKTLFEKASAMVREKSRNTQVGILTDAVWKNQDTDSSGSKTQATFTTYHNANADTKAYIEDGLADFVAVKDYGSLTDGQVPFAEVASWWNNVAQANQIPAYIVQASDRICTADYTGWASPDQLVKQLIEMKNYSFIEGSIYNSLQRLVEDPKQSTTLLKNYYAEKVNPDHILRELTFTKPQQTTFTTQEPSINITGASDPTFEVTCNGAKVKTDDNGFFTVSQELKAGVNTFTFTHKEKTVTFKITRQVDVLKEITPVGNIIVDGSMKVTITAMAYENAQVYAQINGQKISMSIDSTADDTQDKGTSYKKFVGTYTAPAAGAAAQKLGTIKVVASADGITKTKEGAFVTVNKKAVLGDGVLVRVTATQAETFSTNQLNDYSDPEYFPLPAGTLDYAVGNEIVLNEGNTTYSYYKLASGLRVYSKDITATSGDDLNDNTISGISVEADNTYTRVIISTEKPVPYVARYSSGGFSIDFQYTSKTPSSMSLNKNPLFSAANWSGSTLSLPFKTTNGFLGYRAYYEDGNLVFRFNNPSSIGGARILVDPGHGGSDQGASGFNPNYPESKINAMIASQLEDVLRSSYGANVLRLDTSGDMTMATRLQRARDYNAQLYISVHNNSSSSGVAGTEAYYFYPFSKNFATSASAQVSSELGNGNNRGSKFGRFYVTRDSQFAAVLVECGFLTNNNEYNKLIDEDYQYNIARGIGRAASDFFSNTGAQYAGLTGKQSNGDVVSNPLTGIELNKDELTLQIGKTEKLTVEFKPSNATSTISWKSSNTAVATVASDGTVKGIKSGTATITASTFDGKFTAECEVTVTGSSIAVTGVSLNSSSLSMTVGKTETLRATVKPSNATNQEVTWKSSNTSVAAVSDSGVVSAKAAGTATITVTTKDGGHTATCKVTVTSGIIQITGLRLNKTSLTLQLGKNETDQLTVSYSPSGTTQTDVEWSSSKESVVSVDKDGYVTAEGEGTATITITSKANSRIYAKCEVTVKPKEQVSSKPESSKPDSSAPESSKPESSKPESSAPESSKPESSASESSAASESSTDKEVNNTGGAGGTGGTPGP